MSLFRPTAERPRLDLEPTSLERVLNMAAWLGVGMTLLMVFSYWPELPGRVPQHFNAGGEVDAWGPRVLLLMLPSMSLVLVAGLSWLTRFPHLYNFPWPITEENARRQYRLANHLMAFIKTSIAWLFAMISWEICRLGLAKPALFGATFLPIVLVGILAPVVWYFGLAYRER